ncbi:MAG: FmdB family zinc ribbon protein [Thermodesulfobacteriota bacterium]
MPIYEYECTKCGRVNEVWQQMSDKPLKKCSECSGKLQKLISRSSFHLKGSGWYATDYAGKSTAASRNNNKSSDAVAEKGDSQKVSSCCKQQEATSGSKSE